VDPGVRRAEVRWLPRFINVTWQYSKAAYGDAFGPGPRIYSIHRAGRHGGGHAGYYVSPVHGYPNVSDFAWKRATRCAAHYRQCCAVSQSPLPADDPLPLRSCGICRVLSCPAWPG
jgi:hypothetical protein